MRCLWLTGRYPFPAEAGTEVYSRGLIGALARAGAEVTVLSLPRHGTGGRPDEDPTTPNVAWHVVPARRRRRAASTLSPLPAAAYTHSPATLRRALARWLDARCWDVMVIDHIQMGWALGRHRRVVPYPPLVYVSHNHESAVRGAMGNPAAPTPAGWLMSAASALDRRKVSRLEHGLLRQSQLVTAITEEDRAALATYSGDTPVITLSPGYDGPRRPTRRIDTSVDRTAVMVGSFGWRAKQDNLRRFLAAADRRFAEAGAHIKVVGFVPDDLIAELTPTLRATSFAGIVEDLGSELDRARLGLISEPLGGGFKMKALDYIFARVPVAMLAGTASGLPIVAGRDCLSFTDESELAAGALAAMDDLAALDRIQQRAYTACQAVFDWDDRGRTLLAEISAMTRAQKRVCLQV